MKRTVFAALAGIAALTALAASDRASAQEMDGLVSRFMLACNTDGTYWCGERCIYAGTEYNWACCR